MTIEIVTHPKDLSKWNKDDLSKWNDEKQPAPYLELFGETSPLLDTRYAEVIHPGAVPTDSALKTRQQSAPVYEYCWTIGHPWSPPDHHRSNVFLRSRLDGFWNNLRDRAAYVYLYFQLGGGWLVEELAASVKYLRPVAQQRSFWEEAAKDWQTLQPLVNDAGKLAGALEPGIGTAAGSGVRVLNAMAQMKIESVPQTKDFPWSVAKVTCVSEKLGAMQGVVWELPKKMFTDLGGRLTGGLAVSFIPARHQDEAGASSNTPTIQQQHLYLQALVRSNKQVQWAPGPDDQAFIRLGVKPQNPEQGDDASENATKQVGNTSETTVPDSTFQCDRPTSHDADLRSH